MARFVVHVHSPISLRMRFATRPYRNDYRYATVPCRNLMRNRRITGDAGETGLSRSGPMALKTEKKPGTGSHSTEEDPVPGAAKGGGTGSGSRPTRWLSLLP